MKTHELLDRAADEIDDPGQELTDQETRQLVTELRAEAEVYRRAWNQRRRRIDEMPSEDSEG